MTNEEANLTIDYLKEIQEEYIEGEGYERHPLPEWYALDKAIEALEQTQWIPVSERLPKEREWIGTDTFGTTISDEVYVTFEMPNSERFTDHLSFQNGKLSNFKQSEIDTWHKGAKPIAWMPLPKPWKGEQNG